MDHDPIIGKGRREGRDWGWKEGGPSYWLQGGLRRCLLGAPCPPPAPPTLKPLSNITTTTTTTSTTLTHLFDISFLLVLTAAFLYTWGAVKRTQRVYEAQGCISCGPCSCPELTEDHVLPSAYVEIFRTVTRNAVNKSV